MKVDGDMAVRVEQAVREVFEKRFTGRSMPYETARELVWLEPAIREHVIWWLSRPASRGDGRERNNEGDVVSDSGQPSDNNPDAGRPFPY